MIDLLQPAQHRISGEVVKLLAAQIIVTALHVADAQLALAAGEKRLLQKRDILVEELLLQVLRTGGDDDAFARAPLPLPAPSATVRAETRRRGGFSRANPQARRIGRARIPQADFLEGTRDEARDGMRKARSLYNSLRAASRELRAASCERTCAQRAARSSITLSKKKQTLPLVAIVGRPNVGKSTLFNRLTGSRRAIVGDEAGITRDRLYGEAEWRGYEFRVVDTGGIVPEDKDFIPSEIFRQAKVAFEEAAAIVMVVDARTEIAGADRELARL